MKSLVFSKCNRNYKYICFLEYQSIDLKSDIQYKNDHANTSETQIYKMHIYKKDYFTLLFKTWLISSITDQSQTEAIKNKDSTGLRKFILYVLMFSFLDGTQHTKGLPTQPHTEKK